jgi:hypothetical protein
MSENGEHEARFSEVASAALDNKFDDLLLKLLAADDLVNSVAARKRQISRFITLELII